VESFEASGQRRTRVDLKDATQGLLGVQWWKLRIFFPNLPEPTKSIFRRRNVWVAARCQYGGRTAHTNAALIYQAVASVVAMNLL